MNKPIASGTLSKDFKELLLFKFILARHIGKGFYFKFALRLLIMICADFIMFYMHECKLVSI